MEQTLLGLAGVVAVGIAAQWVAWRLRAPAILLLLMAGVLAGSVTGWLDPDALLGDALFPVVSLSVAIILFEGGLSLDVAELASIGRAVRNLTTVGALVTWVGASVAARFVLGFDLGLSALLGAILIVTGPTVIMPLLRQIRPTRSVASIVRWEGLVNDPIGAILAVLVFDVLVAQGLQGGATAATLGIVKVLGIGGALGAVGALLMVMLLARHWVPDFLQSPVALALVVTVFAAANAAMDDAGLLAVTLMGSILASQKRVSIHHILEFKENLRVLLISVLFVILAARLPIDDPVYRDPRGVIFLAILILGVRPLSTALAMIGTEATWRERLFVAWMAPRGIVAAAVASVFALELAERGYPGADRLVPIVFLVIVGTVVIYGLTARPVARLLGVASPNPQGVLIVGASRWVRDLATTLEGLGIDTLLIDSNWRNVARARQRGLRAIYGDVLSEQLLKDVPLDGLGRALAMTPNDEINALASLHLGDEFGRARVFQLPSGDEGGARQPGALPAHLRGRLLFSPEATYAEMTRRYQGGAQVKATPLTDTFDYEALQARYGERALPLFVVTESGGLRVVEASDMPRPKAGQYVVSLVAEIEEPPRPPGAEPGERVGAEDLSS